jgi:predicted transcriptional regulator
MYMLPQEVEVWYIIPSIRKELAKQLTQTHGLSFEKTGKILGISKAAVSQYISNKRANKVCLNEHTKEVIGEAAMRIAENPSMAVMEVQRILQYMKNTRSSCDVCKQYNKEVLNYCNQDPKY